MDFSEALKQLKNGERVSRAGWNGKGMWLKRIEYYSVPQPILPGYIFHLLPWIGMKTADNGFVPWLCSQTDMLADDWGVLDD